MDCGRYAADVAVADGSSPTITTRIGAAGITNMVSLGHYPDQGVLVQGHYEETDIIQP